MRWTVVVLCYPARSMPDPTPGGVAACHSLRSTEFQHWTAPSCQDKYGDKTMPELMPDFKQDWMVQSNIALHSQKRLYRDPSGSYVKGFQLFSSGNQARDQKSFPSTCVTWACFLVFPCFVAGDFRRKQQVKNCYIVLGLFTSLGLF